MEIDRFFHIKYAYEKYEHCHIMGIFAFYLETSTPVIKRRMDIHQGLQNARTFSSENPNSPTAG